MKAAKEYRVEREMVAGDEVPRGYDQFLGHLKVGEVVTVPMLYGRFEGVMSKTATRESKMARLRHAMLYAVSIGMASDVSERPEVPYRDFQSIPVVAKWLGMLNTANVRHVSSRQNGTRESYSYGMYRFNNWLAGKTWSIATRTTNGDGSYRDVRKDVEVRDVAHLLELALEKGGLDRDLLAIIRQFFAELCARKKFSRSVMVQTQCAIKSFFMSHEIQYGLQLPRSLMRGARAADDEWENNELKMSDLGRMLTVGKPTIRDKAVILSKFHRGMDQSTMADRFNYTAFDQIASHMGTDDIRSWDLDKCPVPIVLTRVKTNFKHVGFLERDAISANIDWIAERERLTGGPLRRGDGLPLYLSQHGRPITPLWIGDRFRRLAIRAGLCKARMDGAMSSTRHTHQMRHLLKSTLIDSGCRIDVADHVIGHSPKDTYERQSVLYPDSIRREYAKASGKINIFTNFETSINASDDIHKLRAEVKADRLKLKAVLAAAESNAGRSGTGEDAPNTGHVAEMIAALQHDVRRLQGERDAAQAEVAGVGSGAAGKYQCIPCSLVHSSAKCPACGSAERCMYAGGAAVGR